MPKDFERCIVKVKAKIKAGKLPKGSSAYAICTAAFKKAGKKYKHK